MKVIVNIDVEDLARAIEFYTSAFDLRLRRRLFGGTVAELTGESWTLHLLAAAAGSTAVTGTALTRDFARHWTPVHLDFIVGDAAAAVERTVRAGAKLEREVESFAWGRLATLSDPFGNGFCVVELRGEGYGEA